MSTESELKVYFNSACPVCKAGIDAQKDKSASCPIEWKDVHTDNASVIEIDSELEYVRERLHVVDGQGNKFIGFEAFLILWRNSPTEQWKAKVFSLPVIRQVGGIAYNIFAALLYRWNKALKHW